MKAVVSSWRSLDRRLPLFIAALLLATVAAFTASTYHLVRQVLLRSAAQRLQGASAPLALSLAESARQHRAQLEAVGRDPALVALLTSGGDPAAARRALARAWGADTTDRGRMELRDARGAVVLDTTGGRAPTRTAWADSLIRSGAVRPGRALIGPLVQEGGALFGESLVAIPSPDSAAVGYVVAAVPVVGQGMQAIRELLGRDATFMVGSPGGGVWTDLERLTAPPPAGATAGKTLVYQESARGPGVGAARAIAGTPWLLWVEQPSAAVLTPMRSLLARLAVLAVLLMVAGTVGAWLFSRRITGPIVALADAADRVVPGLDDAAPRQRVGSEVARLTDAFTRMAARVEGSTEELEGRVAERTAQLEEALRELELAQQELVRKERLAMLGQLSSAVGHELRNPLGVMTNALYVIEQCLPDAPALVRDYLDLLRGQIAASERIVGDLLDTARVRAPQAQPIELGSMVDEQLQRLGPTAGVTIEQRVTGDVPSVRMDPTQLSQILLNLITNGVQAMAEGEVGGTLTLEAEADEGGNRVRLAIRDTGPGMPPEVLERIFDPLFTTKARGLGLGLWVSQNLATANGATLRAVSRPGEGSTFTLDMPAAVGVVA